MPADYATPRQVALAAGVHPATAYDWLAAGIIRGVKLGKCWRIPLSEVERLSRVPGVSFPKHLLPPAR